MLAMLVASLAVRGVSTSTRKYVGDVVYEVRPTGDVGVAEKTWPWTPSGGEDKQRRSKNKQRPSFAPVSSHTHPLCASRDVDRKRLWNKLTANNQNNFAFRLEEGEGGKIVGVDGPWTSWSWCTSVGKGIERKLGLERVVAHGRRCGR